MKTKPVIIEYTKNVPPSPEHPTGFLKGATFEVPTPATAKKSHPDARIARYADGESYSEPKAPAPRKSRKKASTARKAPAKAAAPTVPVVSTPEVTPEVSPDALRAPVTNETAE